VLLKSLEMVGFKSFPDKIKIEFGSGMTGIIGPNGSGKSNISDAIRWVLGEQSSKLLRGNRMEDVIFGGTEKRSPLGFAEVTLTIENTARIINMDCDEIAVSRRYYRSGESEYMINKKPVRLRDVHELFMDTGLGRDGYSIIGQGKIDDILSRKSEDRREIFEEAAGIAKFRLRKEEAERKLQSASENLTRLNDITNELQLQIEPLKKKAETAAKYLKIHDELRELELDIWTSRIDGLKSEINRVSGGIKINEMLLNETRTRLEKLYAESERISAQLAQLDADAEKARNDLRETESALSREENSAAVQKTELSNNEAQADRLLRELDEHGNRDDALKARLAERESELAGISDKIDKVGRELSELVEKAGKSAAAIDDLDAKISGLKALETVLTMNRAEIQSELAAAKSKTAELNARCSELDESAKAAQAEYSEGKALGEKLAAEIREQQEKLDSVQNIMNGYELMVKSREDKYNKENDAKTALLAEMNSISSRLNMLKDLEREYEGYSKSVKIIMQVSERGGLSGIIGTVGALLSAPERYTIAIETALGGALQSIITESEEAARDAIEVLKEKDGGRATFLPVSTVKGTKLNEGGLDKEKGYVGIAVDLCGFDKRLEGVFTNLLGRTVVAERLDDAIRIARRYSQRFRIVTLDGQVINAGGAITGGSVAKNIGIMSRANEIKRLTENLRALEEKKKSAEARTAEALRLLTEAKYSLEHAETEKREAQDALLTLKSTQAQQKLMLDSLYARTVSIAEEKSRTEARIAQLQTECATFEAKAASLLSEIELHRAEAEELSKGREGEAAENSRLAGEITEKRVELAALQTSKEAVLKSIEEINELISAATEDRAEREKELSGLYEEIKRQKVRIKEHYEKIEMLKAAVSLKEDAIKAIVDERFELESARSRCDASIRETNDKILELERELGRLTGKKTGCEDEIKNIGDRMWESYEITLGEAAARAKPVENMSAALRRVAELKSKKKSLGDVDLGSVEELKKVSQRYDYLMSQKTDIEKSSAELCKLIGELDEEMKSLFIKSFGEINESFKQTFREIFGGGSAELILEDPTDVLNCGIEIKVSPPGKNLKFLSLLSGGEKTLVAIALYFALFKVRPSPFCVLDEIDAALDETNVARFSAYVKKLSTDTQFILMTHRRGTMEASDKLYGVTMQEQGISKLIAVDLEEIDRRIVKKQVVSEHT
jgi:chromosome segregation protein